MKFEMLFDQDQEVIWDSFHEKEFTLAYPFDQPAYMECPYENQGAEASHQFCKDNVASATNTQTFQDSCCMKV